MVLWLKGTWPRLSLTRSIRSRITVAHVEALLKATPPEQRTDVKPTERENKIAPIEQIEKLQKEMDQVQESYTQAEENYGSDLLNLVVAKGYPSDLAGSLVFLLSDLSRHVDGQNLIVDDGFSL